MLNPTYGSVCRLEAVRLQSFENWPSSHVRPGDLAAAGFYYAGQTDLVQCFECSIKLCSWQDGEDPMAEHQRHDQRSGSECRFSRQKPCGNVPLGADPTATPCPGPAVDTILFRPSKFLRNRLEIPQMFILPQWSQFTLPIQTTLLLILNRVEAIAIIICNI